MLTKATKIRMSLSDNTGYSFNIDAEETFKVIRRGVNREIVEIEGDVSNGWTGSVTLLASRGMKNVDALLTHLLDEARHLVRLLEEELNETFRLKRTAEMETFYDLCVTYGHDQCKDRFKPGAFPDSREVMDTLLEWANEFNKINAVTDWAEVEYMDAIDQFYEAKVKELTAEE